MMRPLPLLLVPLLVGCPWIDSDRHEQLTEDPFDDDDSDETPECEDEVLFADADSDGWGGASVDACDPPAGAVERSGDCNDNDDTIHPEATELCDGIDNDCDPATTEDGTALLTEQDGSLQFDATGLMTGGVPWEVSSAWTDVRLDICPGTYNTTIIAQSADLQLEVRGLGDVRLLPAVPDDRVFFFNSSSVSLSNLTLVGGERDDYGAVIVCAYTELNVSNVDIIGGSAPQGGQLYGFDCSASFRNTTWTDGSAEVGAGLFLVAQSDVQLTDTVIETGPAESAMVVWDASLALVDSDIRYDSRVGVDVRVDATLNLDNVDFPTGVGVDVRTLGGDNNLGTDSSGNCTGTACFIE